jgi:6-phosphofructokinase 1
MKIATLTSGGDAPGMNAALRAIVRVAESHGHEVLGVRHGYQGLLLGDARQLGSRDVGNILQKGGTLLRTSRCQEFLAEEGLRRAAGFLVERQVDALVAIGGDGTFRGCADLARFWNGRILGVPGTIDNDVYGTDRTIGFETAVTTAMDALDKIRDTAEAHERFFLVEVMGRHAGFIALEVAINGGAEEVMVPEIQPDLQAVCDRLCAGKAAGKTSSLIVVAEGAYPGGAQAVADRLRALSGNEYRICILGHVQRGGAPTAGDRLLATRLGAAAVEAAFAGKSGVMVGVQKGDIALTPFAETFGLKKDLDKALLGLIPRLSR